MRATASPRLHPVLPDRLHAGRASHQLDHLARSILVGRAWRYRGREGDVGLDLRRQRARAAAFQIRKLGRNRVFSDYQVSNPQTGGQYTVSIRGFAVRDLDAG